MGSDGERIAAALWGGPIGGSGVGTHVSDIYDDDNTVKPTLIVE